MDFVIMIAFGLIMVSILFNPYFDISKDKIILWYDTISGERKYRILWKNDD